MATPKLASVSYRIADDLKAATYVAPAAPIDAMDENRELIEVVEIPFADRAVIKAMTFGDSLRAELKRENFSEDGWRMLHDTPPPPHSDDARRGVKNRTA